MPDLEKEGVGESDLDISFETLLKERLAQREAQPEETEIATSDEVAKEEQQAATPEPDWREARFPDAPDAHGFYRGKPLGEVDAAIRRMEGSLTDANHRANLAEAKAVAAETAAQMLQEKLRRQLEDLGRVAPQQPAPHEPDVFEAAGIDLEADWVLKPGLVKDLLEKDILTKAERNLLQKIDSRLGEFEQKLKEKDELVEQEKLRKTMAAEWEQKSVEAARTALTQLKIPEDAWKPVLDLLVPTLLSEKYLAKGATTEAENYVELIQGNSLIKAGIAQLVGASAASEPPIANPPGGKAPAPSNASRDKGDPTHGLSAEVLALAKQQARMVGISDPVELEEFIAQAAANIAKNRRRSKERGNRTN